MFEIMLQLDRVLNRFSAIRFPFKTVTTLAFVIFVETSIKKNLPLVEGTTETYFRKSIIILRKLPI